MIYITAGFHRVEPAVFLDMTFTEIHSYIKGKVDAERFDLMMEDKMNHALGQYIAIATHEPNKYPKKPFLEGNHAEQITTKREMTNEEMVVSLKAWMGVWGGKEVEYGK